MKEYLNTETYEYKQANKMPEHGEWVRIPKNANYAGSVGYGVFFSDRKDFISQHIVWVRPTQPEALPFIDDSPQSLCEQYAEIEQVRQAIKDNVNHPSHYTQGKVECLDALESATIGKSGIEAVCVANIIKYLWRYEEKNGLEDVKKANFYLNRLLATLENNNG